MWCKIKPHDKNVVAYDPHIVLIDMSVIRINFTSILNHMTECIGVFDFPVSISLREKCPYSELSWSVFSRIRTEYGEILRISPYPVRMRENADHHNFEYGHFSRSRNDRKNESRKYISQETIYFDQLYMRSMLFQA